MPKISHSNPNSYSSRNESCENNNMGTNVSVHFKELNDMHHHLFGIVGSISDCHPRGPRFDSRLYPRNFFGTGSTQPCEDNWIAT